MNAGRNDEIVSEVGWRPTCSLHDEERWQWQALAAPRTSCEVLAHFTTFLRCIATEAPSKMYERGDARPHGEQWRLQPVTRTERKTSLSCTAAARLSPMSTSLSSALSSFCAVAKGMGCCRSLKR